MDSPLQLLRELFPFGQTSAEQRNAAAVRDLLDTATGLSPQETVATLANTVLPSIGRQPNMHMRFKLLEDVRLDAEQALPTLEYNISHASVALRPHEQRERVAHRGEPRGHDLPAADVPPQD